jgi:primosomal protein N' (replication factor Y)
MTQNSQNQPFARQPARTIGVLLPLPFAEPFDYLAPPELALAPGDFVTVPLGSRSVTGVVWDAGIAHEAGVAPEKLKSIAARLDVRPMPENLMRFIAWVAAYSMSPMGAVLKMAMNVPEAFEAAPQRIQYVRGGAWPERMTPARKQLQEMLIDDIPRSVRDLMELALVGEGAVRGLITEGTLLPIEVAADQPYAAPDPDARGPSLSDGQATAAAELMESVRAGGYRTYLLEGVTGSGKTEVYFEAIAEALRETNAQILVMLPEIALTSQWLDRFQARFGAMPVEWHSGLGQSQRRRAWTGVANGTARVVVGARSALFLPFINLKLMIVDEEHDAAFKQEEGVIYHARDMAVVRASLLAIPIILASATPSLETVINAQSGRYTRLHLPDRHGGAEMPEMTAIDMRLNPPARGQWLSPPLREALIGTYEAGEQTLLFLNRRGYAPLTLCRSCGHRMECPHCSAWLVEHRFQGKLQCHHCGFAAPVPAACPACAAIDSLVPCGPGVERVAEEVAALLPDARLMILTSDVATSPAKTAALVAQITNHEIDVIVGTQIVTKGYHFPKLTMVGVVDADLGLNGGDLRAGERTYQQLAQVAGRAGRELLKGRVWLQTFAPDHPVMEALVSGDWQAFLEREAEMREAQGMPPFGRLAALIVSGEDHAAVAVFARALARSAPRIKGVSVLGPAPAPMALLRGRHRYRLLLKAPKQTNIQALLREWISLMPRNAKVRLQIDIDPQSFF